MPFLQAKPAKRILKTKPSIKQAMMMHVEVNVVDLLRETQTVVLNDANMRSYLKYAKPASVQRPNKGTTHSSKSKDEKGGLFVPKEHDTLFWCFYRMHHGELDYDMLAHKNEVTSSRLKIELVDQVRAHKPLLKSLKLDNVEQNLVHDTRITPKTFLALCAIHKLNVVFVRNRAMIEQWSTEGGQVFVVMQHGHQFGYKVATLSDLDALRAQNMVVEHLDKPLKAISGYTLADLTAKAEKLGVTLDAKPTKQALYETIARQLW